MRNFLLTTLVIAAVTLPVAAQNPQFQINKDNRTISVTTSASEDEVATIANVTIGYIVYGPDEQSTYAAGSQRSNAIAKALADAGIPKDHIQSFSQNLNPVDDNNRAPNADQANRKFQLSQTWGVRVGAESAANVIHLAVLAGANNSGGIDWDISDAEELQSKAAAKALLSAQTVAQAMASKLNVKLGALIFATNEPNNGAMVSYVRAEPKQRSLALGPPPPLAISPLKVQKAATVYAVFAIE